MSSKKTRKRKPPIHPAISRMYLRKKGIKQIDMAKALNITGGAVTLILNGYSHSDRFWNYFYEVTGLKKAS